MTLTHLGQASAFAAEEILHRTGTFGPAISKVIDVFLGHATLSFCYEVNESGPNGGRRLPTACDNGLRRAW